MTEKKTDDTLTDPETNGEDAADEVEDPTVRETPVATETVADTGDDSTDEEAAGEDAEEADNTESEAVEAEDKEEKGGSKKAKKNKKADKETKTPAKAEPAKKAAPSDHEFEALSGSYWGTSEETKPGDPTKSPAWHDSAAEDTSEKNSPKWLMITLVLLVLVIGGAFAMLSSAQKADAMLILTQGPSRVMEARKNAEDDRINAEREARLASAPKFGNIEIITAPQNLLISAQGQPEMIYSGSSATVSLPTRSRIAFQNISVTEPFVFTIHGGGNLEDKVVTVAPFGSDNSPWQQSHAGDYSATLTYMLCLPGERPQVSADFCLTPPSQPEWRARELRWRANWRPDPENTDPDAITRLPGTITVKTEPPGALIIFNGRQLVNEGDADTPREDWTGHVTPFTFNTYNAPADREDRTPSEVYLSREGLPIGLKLDGKADARFGVYLHEFVCNLKEGMTPPPPVPEDAPEGTVENWLGVCDYTYEVQVNLVDPKPAEEGEGSGAAPEGEAATAE